MADKRSGWSFRLAFWRRPRSPQHGLILPDTAIGNEEYTVGEFCRFVERFLLRPKNGAPERWGEAVNVYHVVLYAAEVENGGHAQFVGNHDDQSPVFASALDGLAAIGAGAYEEILRAMTAWTRDNPEEVSKIHHAHYDPPYRLFRPPALDRLDDLFFDQVRTDTINSHIHRWIKGRPNLRIVSEAEFLELLHSGEMPPS